MWQFERGQRTGSKEENSGQYGRLMQTQPSIMLTPLLDSGGTKSKLWSLMALRSQRTNAKADALTVYFSSILGTSTATTWGFDMNIIYNDSPVVDLAHLAAAFTCLEAKHAIQQMNRNSAPGPDGFGPGFYAAAWDTVAPKVMNFVHAFAEGRVDLDRVNRAYICAAAQETRSCDARGLQADLPCKIAP